MAVQFIIGPAGSGKSTYIMNTAAAQLRQDRHKKIIMIVPEQTSFCYQYEFINQYELSGVLTVNVCGFQRLARTVLQQTGGLASHIIDDLGKLLIVRRILQENTEYFPFLEQSVNRSGYLLKIGQMIQELKRYQIGSQQLKQISGQETLPETLFTHKLQEISQLYWQYELFLQERYLDSEDLLNLFIEQLQKRTLFQDVEIWIDEFYDFTPQEYTILGLLMQQAQNVHIALPVNTQNQIAGRQTAFHSTEKTLQHLRQIAQKLQIVVLPDQVCTQTWRWMEYQDLSFLERYYFSTNKCHWSEVPYHLELLQGQNRLSEVDAVARKIRQLCRECNYQYRDIGIFTRGEQYDLLLETILNDYDIPYFMDHKEKMRQHPLTELLLSFFDIVATNWSYQSVFRFIKTELLPFARTDIDFLENYVLQYGIYGGAWYQEKDWHYGKEAEEIVQVMNDLRKQISAPLRKAQLAIENLRSADEITRVLYQLLEDFSIPKRLEQLCQEALENGLLEIAQVHQQIWDKVIQIFDQICELLSDIPLTADDFFVILQTAFDNLDLGLLPSSLDQVFIGALAHSRSRALKAVFILGLNEGIFPTKTEQAGFFNDREKHLLKEMGVELSPNSQEQLYDEQFLIYLALTRASQYSCFSYSLSDEEGKALRPSSIVERLHRLYPKLQEQAVQWPPDDGQPLLPYLEHPGKAMGLLGSHLARKETVQQQEIWIDLYNWFLRKETVSLSPVYQSLYHEKQFAERKLYSTQIYGKPLYLSVSALERYRQCPYSYFLTYGLQLKERLLYKMEAVDVGQFYHTAIERFGAYIIEHQLSWQQLNAESVLEIVKQIVEELTPTIQNEILLSSGRYRYLSRRLQKTVERSALLLLEHGQKGDFVPVALEADFGTKHSKLPQWTIQLQDGTQLYLQGRIDRIEQAVEQNRRYLRIIDFKTGTQGLQLVDIYYGLKIQLLTYLQVALQYYEQLLPAGQELLPAGVLYYFFRNGILATDEPLNRQEAQLLHFHKMRANGLLVADMHALKLAQRDLGTGSSTLLPVSLLAKAAPYLEDPDKFIELEEPLSIFSKYSTATVITKEQLTMLLQHVQSIIETLGEEIHNGVISVRPCRIRRFISCQYCHYQAICQIQTVDVLENSEDLAPLDSAAIWKKLSTEQKEEQQ